MKKMIILFLVFGIAQTAVSGEMYKWVDKKGVTRFTNTAPPPDAQKVGNEINYKAEPITPESEKPDYMKEDKPSKKEPPPSSASSTSSKKKADYRISWSTPRMSGDELTLSGTVEGGEYCKELSVGVYLYDENGNTAKVICTASDVGSGSRILNGKTSARSYYGSSWKIQSTYPDCLR